MLADFIKIRVDEVTKIRISNVATGQGLSMSDFCRMCILKELKNTDENELAINEIESSIKRVEKLKELKKSVNEVTGIIIEGNKE